MLVDCPWPPLKSGSRGLSGTHQWSEVLKKGVWHCLQRASHGPLLPNLLSNFISTEVITSVLSACQRILVLRLDVESAQTLSE